MSDPLKDLVTAAQNVLRNCDQGGHYDEMEEALEALEAAGGLAAVRAQEFDKGFEEARSVVRAWLDERGHVTRADIREWAYNIPAPPEEPCQTD